MNNEAQAARAGLLSGSSVDGRLSDEAKSKLSMLAYFLNDESAEGANFRLIVDELMKVAPRGYGRVLDYLRRLSRNLATDPQADPREYAKKVIRGRDETP